MSTSASTATVAENVTEADAAGVDVIDLLVGIEPGSALDAVRRQRPDARANAQASYAALFTPADPGTVTGLERYVIATFVAGLSQDSEFAGFYAAGLEGLDGDGDLLAAVRAETSAGLTAGPYGHYPAETALGAENTDGLVFSVDADRRSILGDRLAAALEHTHLLVLRPREASRDALQTLIAAGWTATDIVTLTQLVSFLSFQGRVIAGLRLLAPAGDGAGAERTVSFLAAARENGATGGAASTTNSSEKTDVPGTDVVLDYPELDRPTVFTQANLGWVPWLEPVAEDDLSDFQRVALVDKGRAKSPYFRLLARDPEILLARTKTDMDIFYNTKAGMPRAERELAAAATSRYNGCIFCASVHSRFAAHYSKRPDDVQLLLDDGVDAPQSELWRAVIDASIAVTATPSRLAPAHIEALRAQGLDDLAISDALHGAAFFNWANRLMLSLGEPESPIE